MIFKGVRDVQLEMQKPPRLVNWIQGIQNSRRNINACLS